MTTFLVALSDGRIAEVDCAETTTRQDGSLWCLAAVDPPPQKHGRGDLRSRHVAQRDPEGLDRRDVP